VLEIYHLWLYFLSFPRECFSSLAAFKCYWWSYEEANASAATIIFLLNFCEWNQDSVSFCRYVLLLLQFYREITLPFVKFMIFFNRVTIKLFFSKADCVLFSSCFFNQAVLLLFQFENVLDSYFFLCFTFFTVTVTIIDVFWSPLLLILAFFFKLQPANDML